MSKEILATLKKYRMQMRKIDDTQKYYRKVFLEDGQIDADEQKKLDHLESLIKKIETAIDEKEAKLGFFDNTKNSVAAFGEKVKDGLSKKDDVVDHSLVNTSETSEDNNEIVGASEQSVTTNPSAEDNDTEPVATNSSEPVASSNNTYTIVSGDTGYGIAAKLGINFSDLDTANSGINWSKLKIGQEINLPAGTTNNTSSTNDDTSQNTTAEAGDTNGNFVAEDTAMSSLIQGGESGAAEYNAYNRGTSGGKILGALFPRKLVDMTIGEIKADQKRGKEDENRLFAVGKYQMIPVTLAEGVAALNIPDSAKYSAKTQEILFADFLLGKKRPDIPAYIKGQGTLYDAQLAGAKEWASIACPPGHPKAGSSYYGNGNHASISAQDFGNALKEAKADYSKYLGQGMSSEDAYRKAMAGVSNDADNAVDNSNNDAGEVDAGASPTTTTEPTGSEIQDSVGKGGANDTNDVLIVQKLLKDTWGYDLNQDGVVDDKTIQAIRKFQHRYSGMISSQDSRIDAGGKTWKYLSGVLTPEMGYSEDGVMGTAETEREKKMAEFTQAFSGIQVEVGSGEIVTVRPPYHINLGDRKTNAANARASNSRVNAIINQMGWNDTHGKATPSAIKSFLEQCVAKNLINDKTSQGMYDFLAKYGVSTDCSGLATQAANFLTDGDLERGNDEEFGIEGTSTIQSKYPKVSTPNRLQAGDMMVNYKREGTRTYHVRVVIDVDTSGDGIQFTTVESGASTDLGDGGNGVGQRRWEFPDATKFSNLKILKGNNWQTAGASDQAYIYVRMT